MSTLLIENLNYKTLPKENLPVIPLNVTELRIVNCKYCKIQIISQDWMNLERIIIERCGYCDVDITIIGQSNLTEIAITQSNYMKIKSISCDSNTFQSITCDSNKYLTFKGILRTGVAIKELRFLDCPYCDIQMEGQLVACERLHFVNCMHGHIKLERMNIPSLLEFGIFNSSYFTFKKSSIILPNLRYIQIANSSYSSIPDFRMYPAIQEITVINSNYLGIPDSLPKQLIQQRSGVPSEFKSSSENPLDQLKKIKQQSNLELSSNSRLDAHYCPFCGEKIQPDFKHCPQCNSPLEYD